MHVFGPFARFPLTAERAYNVAEALLEPYEAMKRQVGLERTVLVQASGYGNDNRAMLAALEQLGPRGRHLQVFASAATLAALEPVLASCAIAIVIDHMGFPDAAGGTAQPGFQAVLRLLEGGHVWVKLAGADRASRATGRLRDAIPFTRALAHAAPERLVWGSDWPHIGFHPRGQVRGDAVLPHRELDAGELLDVLIEAVADSKTLQSILVDNPARLYGFTA